MGTKVSRRWWEGSDVREGTMGTLAGIIGSIAGNMGTIAGNMRGEGGLRRRRIDAKTLGTKEHEHGNSRWKPHGNVQVSRGGGGARGEHDKAVSMMRSEERLDGLRRRAGRARRLRLRLLSALGEHREEGPLGDVVAQLLRVAPLAAEVAVPGKEQS